MSESKKAMNSDHKAYVDNYLVTSGEAAEWEVVLPKANQLLLDFDQPFPFASDKFAPVFSMLKERFKGAAVGETMYKSRSGNTHFIIELPESICDLERVAWQAAFGSDPKREAGHLLSLNRGDTNPILLIMRKDR